MPFSGSPVFLLSPRGMYWFRVPTAPLTDLRHLQGIDRYIYRRQDSSGADPKTAASELPLLSQHALPSSEDRAIGASPHERSFASQRTKRSEAYLRRAEVDKAATPYRSPLTAFLRS